MKIKDFAIIIKAKTGKKRILAYNVIEPNILEKYFKECNYKPAKLAEKLNMHYQSCRKLLKENDLWKYVSIKNGKGSGPNRKRFKQTTRNGYLYSKDPNKVKYSNGRCRRKMEHICIMEENIGREVNKEEIVHHINLNKLDNRIENLHLCSKSEHGKIHSQLQELAGKLVEKNLIYFNKKTGKYEFDKKFIKEYPIISEALEWK